MSFSVLLGYVTKPFGVKGGVFVKLLNPETSTLSVGKKLTIIRKQSSEITLIIDAILDGGRVFFRDITSLERAMEIVGGEISMNRDDLPLPTEHEFYLVDLLDAEVVDSHGEPIGQVSGFSHNGAQDLLNVRKSDGRVAIIPFVKPIVESVDYQKRLIIIDPPIGLLQLAD